MIITKTPYRISLFGGGTDHPEWFNLNNGHVISFAINRFCYITLRNLPPFFEHKSRFVYSKIEDVNSVDEISHPAIKGVLNYYKYNKPIELHHDGDLPARSGIGSSSSFTVGFILALNALRGFNTSKSELSKSSIHVERKVLKESVGMQDQIAVTYGGFNKIDFSKKDNFSVSPYVLNSSRVHLLESHFLLFYTGISRLSTDITREQLKNIKSNYSSLKEIYDICSEADNLLRSTKLLNLNQIGKLLNESWLLKRSLSKSTSNASIDLIYKKAIKNGAYGGKILGAGGGGFILFLADPFSHNRIKKALTGLVHVPIKIEFSGSSLLLLNSKEN
jgi:D-glycero-alpha-D-manno-heptose-7-phosphate kinase